MKLILTNFSTDVSLTGQDGQSYVVFLEEESGKTFRLPAPQEMLVRLSQILNGDYTGEPPVDSDEPEQPISSFYPPMEESQPEPEKVDEQGALGDPNIEPDDEPAPAPVKKKMGLPPAGPMRLSLAKVKQQLNGPPESKVPSL